jgi:hypothetical protein
MFIKSMVIEGVEGDVEIARTDEGALVSLGNQVLCEIKRYEPREARFTKARRAACAVCGSNKRGEPNATNSMVHDVLEAIERVAGC